MMLIILLGIVGAAMSQCSFNGVQRALNDDLDDQRQADGAAAAFAPVSHRRLSRGYSTRSLQRSLRARRPGWG